MKHFLGNIWNSDLLVLFRRLAVVYIALGLCRLIFILINKELFGSFSASEFWPMLHGALKFDSASIVWSFVVFILMSMLPLKIRAKKGYHKTLFWVYIVSFALIVLINLADVLYFHYTGIRITAADLVFTNNDNNAGLVVQFIAENWYLLLLWVALIAGAAWVYRYTGKPGSQIGNNWIYYIWGLVKFAIVLVIAVALIRGGSLSRMTRPMHLSNALKYVGNQSKAHIVLSNPFCIVRTLGDKSIKYEKYFSQEELSQIYTPYHYPVWGLPDSLQDEKLKNIPLFERPNIVLFVLESFSAEHSALLKPELYPDGEGYTPFLDSLMRNGYYFKRAYCNGKKSIDALPSMLASIPPLKKPFVTMPQSIGENRALPRLLVEQGYYTSFFCGSASGSMGFEAFVKSAGVEQIYDMSDYDRQNSRHKDFDNYWGIWDEPMLNYMGKELSRMEEPFFSAIFTLSSHHPFNVPEKYLSTLPAGETKVQRPVAYTDLAIRKFFEQYGDSDWFQNTIFIFCGDHVSSERFSPEASSSVGSRNIMAFFYTPDGRLKGADNSVFQQIDIMPSVLGLLRYEKPYFGYGNDVFTEQRRVAIGYDNMFMAITDSVTVFHDETSIAHAYRSDDLMEDHNIANGDQDSLGRYLEAFVQQYYQHLELRDYQVHEDK